MGHRPVAGRVSEVRAAPEVTPVAAHEAGPAKRLIGIGAVVLLLGAVCWFLHVLAAADGPHAWQAGDPPAAVTVKAGHVYHLSTRGGIVDATARTGSSDPDAFACTYTGAAGVGVNLVVTAVSYDARVLHRIATFVAPENGPLTIVCPMVGPVYVDDATSADFDLAGFLLIPTVLLGVSGVIVLLAGVVRLDRAYPRDDDVTGLGMDDLGANHPEANDLLGWDQSAEWSRPGTSADRPGDPARSPDDGPSGPGLPPSR